MNSIAEQHKENYGELVNPNSDKFNFELWAIAVRHQMLNVLQQQFNNESLEEKKAIETDN
ncbi:hypothetical protein IQ238_13870 [Pleurocapsales cyanobacterium LEGE 06147]|nr:hypothetical protein [Pleurocapsales cyanobacterium LEGE 06147]